jgi:WhiB family redox-sensing transcriptional regulator
MTISPPSGVGTGPASLTDEELQNFVTSPLAACAGTALDPDEWFPIAAKAARARAEANRALGVCATCPVRAECLELSLRTWSGAGQHGIWGGLVEADRNALRREWTGGVPVTALLARLARDR